MPETPESNGASGAAPLLSRIDSGLSLTDRRMAEIVAGSDPIVTRYLGEFSLNRGKLLRPRLLLTFSELFGGGPLNSLANCAACCELLHIATLIHDDVIDEADTRRGRPTLSARFGNEIAVIVGDYVLALTLRALNEERDFLLNDMLLATSQELGLGVIEEVVNRGNFSMSAENYFEVIYLKTAALFSLCCRIGAYLGGASPAQVTLAGQYGKELGLGFQVIDDLLDLTEESATLGKPALSDIREGRVTLPLIHAHAADAAATHALIERFLDGGAGDSAELLRAHLSALGSLSYAFGEAQRFVAAARNTARELFSAAGTHPLLAELEQLERRVLAAVKLEASALSNPKL